MQRQMPLISGTRNVEDIACTALRCSTLLAQRLPSLSSTKLPANACCWSSVFHCRRLHVHATFQTMNIVVRLYDVCSVLAQNVVLDEHVRHCHGASFGSCWAQAPRCWKLCSCSRQAESSSLSAPTSAVFVLLRCNDGNATSAERIRSKRCVDPTEFPCEYRRSKERSTTSLFHKFMNMSILGVIFRRCKRQVSPVHIDWRSFHGCHHSSSHHNR